MMQIIFPAKLRQNRGSPSLGQIVFQPVYFGLNELNSKNRITLKIPDCTGSKILLYYGEEDITHKLFL